MTDEREADGVSKFTIANLTSWRSLVGVLVTAVFSGCISYVVSLNTVRLEEKRIASLESLEKARIFQELVKSAEEQEDPTYAILALWKVYPDDEELIVATALLNPSLLTVGTLHALGFAEKLKDHEASIKAIMVNAPREKREEFTSVYLEISPRAVLEVNYESFMRRDGAVNTRTDLNNLLARKPELATDLMDLISKDARLNGRIALRTRLALLLYEHSPTLMQTMLSEAEADADGEMFYYMAKEMRSSINKIVQEHERIFPLIVHSMEKVEANAYPSYHLGALLPLYDTLARLVEPGNDIAERFRDLAAQTYRTEARDGRANIQLLSTLARHAADPAVPKRLFLMSLACLSEQDSFRVKTGLPDEIFDELKLADWSLETEHSIARRDAMQFLKDNGWKECASW